MAPLGAGWQEHVLNLIHEARLVVVVLGTSEGIMWELAAAMRVLPPERVLLAVPMTQESYEAFRARTYPTVRNRLSDELRGRWQPPSLPRHPGGGRPGQATLKGFVYFTTGWEARFVPLTMRNHSVVARDFEYAAFKRGLRAPLRSLAALERGAHSTT